MIVMIVFKSCENTKKRHHQTSFWLFDLIKSWQRASPDFLLSSSTACVLIVASSRNEAPGDMRASGMDCDVITAPLSQRFLPGAKLPTHFRTISTIGLRLRSIHWNSLQDPNREALLINGKMCQTQQCVFAHVLRTIFTVAVSDVT